MKPGNMQMRRGRRRQEKGGGQNEKYSIESKCIIELNIYHLSFQI